MKPTRLLIYFLWAIPVLLFAQWEGTTHLVPLHRDVSWLYERSIQDTDAQVFTAIRPLTFKQMQRNNPGFGVHASRMRPVSDSAKAGLVNIPLPKLGSNGFTPTLHMNPMLDVGLRLISARNYYEPLSAQGGGGLDFTAELTPKLTGSFRFMALAASRFYPDLNWYPGPDFAQIYTSNRHPWGMPDIFMLQVMPGMPLNHRRDGLYAANWTEAYLSWEAAKFLDVSVGNGKQFYGEGYRSLALSDNAYAYPYLRLNTHFWKIQYTNIWASQQNLRREEVTGHILPTRKFMAVQILQYRIHKKWDISFYESIIWTKTQSGGNKTWDLNYLNPAVFYHPVNYSLNSMGNALMALNLKYKLNSNYTLYGQLMIDDFNSEGLRKGNGFFQNKVGGQLGMKAYDFLGVKGFFLLAEGNAIRPYAYGNRQPELNYSHQGQALAHPAGANLLEGVLIFNYMRNGWIWESKTVLRGMGRDYWYDSHFGSNIMLDESGIQEYSYGNTFLQGRPSTRLMQDIRIAKVLHTPSRLTAECVFRYADPENPLHYRESGFQFLFGVRCQLYNYYRD
jgi:hypothetical protein